MLYYLIMCSEHRMIVLPYQIRSTYKGELHVFQSNGTLMSLSPVLPPLTSLTLANLKASWGQDMFA